MRLLIAILLTLMIPLAESRAADPEQDQSDIMKFDMHPPDAWTIALIGGNAWTIYASGIIDETAPARFLALVRKNRVPAYSTVYIHSPGGNLTAAMKLGEAIRSSGFNTEVGIPSWGDGPHTLSGICLSACTLAFLGGRWRYMASNSIYGVHRFYFQRHTELDGDVAQLLSALVVQYIRDMGADPQLFSAMTISGKNEVTAIPEGELLRLNVVNNGETPTEWTVQSALGVVYLKGQRDTVYGLNKFMLACSHGRVVLTVMFEPQGNERAILGMKEISLLADDQQYPLEAALTDKPKLTSGGLVAAVFLLPKYYVDVLKRAHTVGVSFQFGRGAAIMFGFQGMKFDGAIPKLEGVIGACSGK